MNASTASARTLVHALLATGVRDVVLSPGSRSAPLVYAFADAEAALSDTPRPLHLHVRIDERDAAFTALGIAKAGRLTGAHRPVVVVTTSGSAVGNLHPAVMEAAHAHLPLVLVTADRPARLRRTGANQTLDAQHESLPEVVAAWDLPVPPQEGSVPVDCAEWATAAEAAVARACTSPAGPVQLNTQFDAPLVPDAGTPSAGSVAVADVSRGGAETGRTAAVWQEVRSVLADSQARPVIVAGDDLGFSTRTLGQLARQYATPVLAEPSSALAAHPRTIPAHARVLGRPEAQDALARITHVVVTGRPTLSRPVARLLDRTDVVRIDVPYDADGLEDTVGPVGSESREPGAPAETGASAENCAWWAEWESLAQEALDTAPSEERGGGGSAGHDGAAVAVDAAIRALLERPGILVAASSNTVRHIARLQRPHHPARVVASRGLAGIDGLVATASGLALGLEGTAPVRLLIGDLAALHDLGGFVVPRHERRPRLQVVVLNDDGGAIFAGLEHSQPHVAARFDRFFGTPHGLDLAEAARALGMRVESADVTGADGYADVTGAVGSGDVTDGDGPGDGHLDRFRTFLDGGEPGLFQFRLPSVRA